MENEQADSIEYKSEVITDIDDTYFKQYFLPLNDIQKYNFVQELVKDVDLSNFSKSDLIGKIKLLSENEIIMLCNKVK